MSMNNRYDTDFQETCVLPSTCLNAEIRSSAAADSACAVRIVDSSTVFSTTAS